MFLVIKGPQLVINGPQLVIKGLQLVIKGPQLVIKVPQLVFSSIFFLCCLQLTFSAGKHMFSSSVGNPTLPDPITLITLIQVTLVSPMSCIILHRLSFPSPGFLLEITPGRFELLLGRDKICFPLDCFIIVQLGIANRVASGSFFLHSFPGTLAIHKRVGMDSSGVRGCESFITSLALIHQDKTATTT